MSPVPVKSGRTGFTADEDILLMKYIATHNPTKKYRSGNVLYKRLEENADGKWNWSKTHSWQSWQTRYRKNMEEFDRKILRYQKKKGINPEKPGAAEPLLPPSDEEEETARERSKETSKGKRRAGGQVGSGQWKTKRAKLERDQPDIGSSRSPLIKINGTSQVPAVRSSDRARSSPPDQGPSEPVSDVPPPPPKPASTLNIPLLLSPSDTLPVLSSQPNSPVRTQPPVTPKPLSGPKRGLKNKSVSPVFRSFSPTPNNPTPPKKQNLPKVAEGHFSTTLADRLGRVRPGARSEREGKQTKAWPPVRDKKGKEKELTPAQERERHPVNGVEAQTSRPAVVPPKREPHRYSVPDHSTPSAAPVDLPNKFVTPGPAILPVPLAFITPADLPLSASVGFRSLISRIAAAHGYSPDVVLEIYKRVESLEETEKCVRGMRDASENWIEAALEQREREARRARRASGGKENGRKSSESNESDDEALRVSRHRPSSRQALLEQRLPNGLQVRHEPGSYESKYGPRSTTRAALKKRTSMGGSDSVSASWRAGATGYHRTNQADDEVPEVAVDSSEDGDDETASGEDDEENSDDIKQAEEEDVVERLVSESPSEDLQEQDVMGSHPEHDAENELELASNDAEPLDEDDWHHEFSRMRPHDIRMKSESMTPPSLSSPHRDSAQNGGEVLNGALSDIGRTRSTPPPWNADEGKHPLSGTREMRQMLERQWGKAGMKKRVAQLLR